MDVIVKIVLRLLSSLTLGVALLCGRQPLRCRFLLGRRTWFLAFKRWRVLLGQRTLPAV